LGFGKKRGKIGKAIRRVFDRKTRPLFRMVDVIDAKTTIESAKNLQKEIALFFVGILVGIVTNFLAAFIPQSFQVFNTPPGLIAFVTGVIVLVGLGLYMFSLFGEVYATKVFEFDISDKDVEKCGKCIP